MITPDGVVKVLDFGLAFVATEKSADPMNSPTLTMRATEAGMIMGTAAYMSPEQASGKPVDKRSDIWSFGVVLWEMLTGQRLFEGETISHTLADVLRGPIDLDKLPKETPRAIHDLLRRCLDRDVKTRLRDIGEARVVIGRYLADPKRRTEGAPQAGTRATRLPWVVAGVATLIAIGLGYLTYRHTSEEASLLVKMLVPLPEKAIYTNLHEAVPSLSPDGRHIAFTATSMAKLLCGFAIWMPWRPGHSPARRGRFLPSGLQTAATSASLPTTSCSRKSCWADPL